MILVADVDLTRLNQLHTYGSVRNLLDRRTDLYEVKLTPHPRTPLPRRGE